MKMPENTPDSSEVAEVKLKTARVELELRTAELRQKNWDFYHPPTSFFSLVRSPAVTAAIFASFATLGATAITLLSAASQRETDRQRLELQTILEMIRTGDPDKAAANVEFFGGLVPSFAPQLQKYLAERRPSTGPALPPPKKSSVDPPKN